MKIFKRILSAVLALAMVFALAACGSSGSSSGESESENGTSSSSENDNSVTVGISQELDSLDPHNASLAGTREVLFNIFDGLVKATSDGDLEPAVAQSYEVSEDAASITFVLRDGIQFSDGSYVTVDDVIYSVERYAEGTAASDAFLEYFESITAVDDSTILVTLTEANTEFIYEMTCEIMPEANDENVETNPIGTGPFKIESYTAGDSLVVSRNEYYWKDGLPYLDEVTFKVVTDTDTAILQLNAGTLDIFQYLTVDEASTLSDDFNIVEGSVNYVQALYLNNDFEPFSNILVRQALCYAIDKDEINSILSDGKAYLLGTQMIETMGKYYNTETESVYSYDPDKALELLEEAGYGDGFSFTIAVPSNYAPHQSVAEIIVDQLAEIGIDVTIELMDMSTWLETVYQNREYEATIVAVDGDLAPNSWMARFVSTASNNFINFESEEFDELYALAVSTIDDDEKTEYYKELQMILTENAASVFIQDNLNLVAVNADLEGYIFYPISAQDMSVVKYKD